MLLWLLAELRRHRPLPPLVAVHVDHGLRRESGQEAAAAVAFCRRLGVACDVRRLQATGGETDARARRWREFARAAAETRAAALLLAHHRDDQIETLLLRLLRGTGPLGLSGIPELRPLEPGAATLVFRPLLDVARSDLHAALRDLGLPSCHDASNDDPEHGRRNAVRHRLLPALRSRDPGDRALRALHRQAQALARQVRRQAAGFDTAHVDGGWRLELASVAAASPWAIELAFTRALERMGQPQPGRRQMARLVALCGEASRTGARVEARRRWQATRRRDHVFLRNMG
jgi:tRNA(Ile)-lysidine synthase